MDFRDICKDNLLLKKALDSTGFDPSQPTIFFRNCMFACLEPMLPTQTGQHHDSTNKKQLLSVKESYARDYANQFLGKLNRGTSSSSSADDDVFHPLGSNRETIIARFISCGFSIKAVAKVACTRRLSAKEPFDEHAALALNLDCYAVACAFGGSNDGDVRSLLPWLDQSLNNSLSTIKITTIADSSQDTLVGDLYGRIYTHLYNKYPAIRKMVKSALKTDFMADSTDDSSAIQNRFKARGGEFWIALDMESFEVVGCIGVRRRKTKECEDEDDKGGPSSPFSVVEYEVQRLAVDDKHRGKGIGKRLLNAVYEYSLRQGILEKKKKKGVSVKLLAVTPEALVNANNLYNAFGFIKEESFEGEVYMYGSRRYDMTTGTVNLSNQRAHKRLMDASATMMRLPTIVTLLTLVSAILSAASADNSKDADAIGQSGSLRGAGTDTSIHQSLLKAIEADELGEFDASDLVLQEPLPDQNDRELGLCGDDAKVFKVDLTTGNDGSGTSWRFFRYDDSTKKWSRVGIGPDGVVAYDGKTRYVQRICVDPATYAFVMRETKGQSFSYSCSFKGSKIFEKESSFSGRKVHYFSYTEENSSSPTPKPINPNIGGRLADCNWNERLFTISLQADQYGNEISWILKDQAGNTKLQSSRTYKNFETDTVEACISAGAYQLIMMDSYGDGITDKGYYRIYIDGVLTFQGGKNYKTKTHAFVFGPQDMTDRDQQWLDSHNTRRETWHRAYGKSFVPLKWSASLKRSSQQWAKELLKTCGQSLYHDPNNKKYGENLASNSGSGSWANVKSTESIVGRFVEWEQDWKWPRNAHLTQVLWRGTDHVGCAEMAKDLGMGRNVMFKLSLYPSR
ncbi:hypothetical protein QTG54_004994 [Skeletonema marinoi]|uniref:N-acetyltransferase domain-containing protein n=1 Tax=Skeletonema marinoi TaxID=267567 RepID=A0AAD9DE93_9STRA|nr:hypothetical protein QTG54_004994 [Skeletonema marinoi]